MGTVAGGLRARMIKENIYNLVNDGLEDLGWFDSGRDHKSVVCRSNSFGNDEVLEPNIVVVTADDSSDRYMELGSLLTEESWLYYVDVYAENEAVGLHLAGDVKGILAGRFPTSVSRIGPDVDIYDVRVDAATPHVLFSVELDGIDLNRGRSYTSAIEEFWWSIDFVVLDEYTDEEG